MQLLSLNIANFKNIVDASLQFSPKINCLLGNNGMGKSNLLDAIYYLSVCRSFTGVTDAMVIRAGEEFATARACYLRKGVHEELTLGMSRGKRKTLRRGGKEYTRLSEHIGLFPLVLASPADIDLIRGSSDERRRWMDMVISQSDRRYLDALIRYNTGLEQRNRMLKDKVNDRGLYDAVEFQMDVAAQTIHSTRMEWTNMLCGLTRHFYSSIAGLDSESVQLAYRGFMKDGKSLIDVFERNRQRDAMLGYTTSGPHRDDIELMVNSLPMRRTASQGQCKTLTTAMRFAQYEFLRRASGVKPLLLLDDIFDKLDSSRVERIVNLVTSNDFGQIFITDTNREHLDEIMNLADGSHKLWTVHNGIFNELP